MCTVIIKKQKSMDTNESYFGPSVWMRILNLPDSLFSENKEIALLSIRTCIIGIRTCIIGN